MGPRALLIITLVALLLGLSCAIALAWSNTGSRNIALATGALAGAMLLFLLQLPFELRGSRETTFISAEYTIDRQERSIRQWNYSLRGHWRLPVEAGASTWLAQRDPARFDRDRERLAQDLTWYSVLNYLSHELFDWQMGRVTFRGNSMGNMTTFWRSSSPTDCAELRPSDLSQLLTHAGNTFAESPVSIVAGVLCLPPSTAVVLTNQEMRVSNAFCTITLRLRPSGSTSYMKPGTGGDVPKLASGEARYETYLNGIDVMISFSGLRSQHRDAQRYRDWARRFVNGLRDWFEDKSDDAAA